VSEKRVYLGKAKGFLLIFNLFSGSYGLLLGISILMFGCTQATDSRDSPQVASRSAAATPREATELRGSPQGERLYHQAGREPLTGWVKDLYDDGKLKALEQYRNGLLDGSSTKWYENGLRMCEGEFRAGQLHGIAATWHENGQKQGESHLVDGKLDGTLTVWDEQGRKIKQEQYRNGVAVP